MIDLVPEKTATGYRINPVAGGYLLVTYPPQHVGETSNTKPEEIARGQKPVFGATTPG